MRTLLLVLAIIAFDIAALLAFAVIKGVTVFDVIGVIAVGLALVAASLLPAA